MWRATYLPLDSLTKARNGGSMVMQILVCESEPMIHELISEYLSPLGFKVMFARNEEQCLDIMNKKMLDAVILDTHLPVSNCAQTVKKIRAKGLKTPVLLVASEYGITSIEDAINLGANGFIEKPFKMKDFLHTVLSVMPN
jgi:DNA-binding response OmpR family regulator